ncbi:sodium:calcium antiporter [Natranaerofaba carboxydovora]|uniref:sodium:calcium antiporter n=1 Tax=Natranaerofaba carboxydovora TaxID=2742683 RepID=UPI001F141B1A|nr:hypothetical protein [Natranaerofaba carboxydovora]UMZ73813.1 Inner membrane protein YrbG [Natranaerofaba carboxydovora]
MLILWIVFILLSILIFVSGATLSKTADKIAIKTGIGGLWIGALTLPLITSIPEVVVGIRAASIEAVDLAMGNLFGSNMLNLSIIIFIDFFSGKKQLSRSLQQGHILTSGLYIVMVGVALLGMSLEWIPSIGFIGVESIIIALIYISTIRFISRDQKRRNNESLIHENIQEVVHNENDTTTKNNYKVDLKRVSKKDILIFVSSAIVAILASRGLADTGNLIAIETGLKESLFGSIFIAISTTLPEIVIIISAARIGAVDMAVGNILGANLLNIGLIFLVDLFYLQGPLLLSASKTHLISGIITVVMTAILIIGVTYRSQRNIFGIGLDTVFILLMYCVGLINIIVS